jgi:hypothetical protein
MSYRIDGHKVAGVVVEANRLLSGKGFNHAEVALGLVELAGRTVVDATPNKINADEMVDVLVEHLKRTVSIGCQVAKQSTIEIPR